MANIEEVKQSIREAVTIYLSKDKNGEYVVPVKQQRPIAILGAPGVGKTEAVRQVAEECKIGFVDCSITHHTRQSAIGLPIIVEKGGNAYGKETYKTTVYTLGEIIGRVQEAKDQGYLEGIIFLDEFNCASETLAPTMMQFLQKKEFGAHKLPDGWIIVVAGNQREYNKSVKELDMVTRDRLRIIYVEQNYECWKKYMKKQGIHNTILEFLEQHKNAFYVYEKSGDGIEFVTPRSWSELSVLLREYEKKQFAITLSLIQQFIQSKKVSMEFYSFYEIYEKILRSKDLLEIFQGKNLEKYKKRYASISLDKKWALISALIQKTIVTAESLCEVDECIRKQYDILIKLKSWLEKNKEQGVGDWLENELVLEKGIQCEIKELLEKASMKTKKEQWNVIREEFEEKKSVLQKEKSKFDSILTNSIVFLQETFGRGEELDVYMHQLLYQKECCIAAGKIQNEAFIDLCRAYEKQDFDLDKEITEELKEI